MVSNGEGEHDESGTKDWPSDAAPPDQHLFSPLPDAPATKPTQPTDAPRAEQPTPPRERDRWLWAWPVALIAAMAVLGQFQGPFGVMAAGVGVTGVLILYIGVGVLSQKLHFTLAAAVCVLAIGVFVGGAYEVIGHRPLDAASSTSSSSRELPSADQLRAGPVRGAALNGINLDRQTLRDVEFQGITASGASMENTILEGAKLAGADLRGTNLAGAHLRGADLRGANLAGADLHDADLTDACLRGANLAGADTTGVDADGAAIDGAIVSAQQIQQAKTWPSSTPESPASCPN